jgi:uncharacterized damage-inducible protein DinB
MSTSLMEAAFAHHVWATQRLIDACLPLTPEQLEITVPGTYGSIIRTQRHLVGSDSWYLFDITGDAAYRIDEKQMGLEELRRAMEVDGAAWSRLLAQDPDPTAVITEVDESDGFERDATLGIRLAQALHHGSDHRSQICTALTSLGMEPPSIDVWDYGNAEGGIFERPPSTS